VVSVKNTSVDFAGRVSQALAFVERWVKEQVRLDGDINVAMALMLGRLHVCVDDQVRAGDLREKGYYVGSNATYNLNQLERKGYIERVASPRDKRVVLILLTNKGRQVGERVSKALADLDTDVGSIFSQQDFEELRTSLLRGSVV